MLIAKIGIRLHGFDFNFTVLIRIGQEKRRRNQQSIGSDPVLIFNSKKESGWRVFRFPGLTLS
jgi:hypothetical protein